MDGDNKWQASDDGEKEKVDAKKVSSHNLPLLVMCAYSLTDCV